jgi:hypothetical protein
MNLIGMGQMLEFTKLHDIWAHSIVKPCPIFAAAAEVVQLTCYIQAGYRTFLRHLTEQQTRSSAGSAGPLIVTLAHLLRQPCLGSLDLFQTIHCIWINSLPAVLTPGISVVFNSHILGHSEWGEVTANTRLFEIDHLTLGDIASSENTKPLSVGS